MWSNCTGTLWIWRCVRCGQDREDREVPLKEHPPKCASGGNRRPAVVWFWEELPAKALGRSYRALEACDLFFAIGPSAVVQPAPSFLDMAREYGARTAEINLTTTSFSRLADWSILGRADEVLPELVRCACKA